MDRGWTYLSVYIHIYIYTWTWNQQPSHVCSPFWPVHLILHHPLLICENVGCFWGGLARWYMCIYIYICIYIYVYVYIIHIILTKLHWVNKMRETFNVGPHIVSVCYPARKEFHPDWLVICSGFYMGLSWFITCISTLTYSPASIWILGFSLMSLQTSRVL